MGLIPFKENIQENLTLTPIFNVSVYMSISLAPL
jgi:hypothetical protein